MRAYVMVSFRGTDMTAPKRALGRIPGVVESHNVYGCDNGDNTYMTRVEAEDNRALDRIIFEGIQRIPETFATRTWIVCEPE